MFLLVYKPTNRTFNRLPAVQLLPLNPHLGVVTEGALRKNDALHAVGQEACPWSRVALEFFGESQEKQRKKWENPGTQWRCLDGKYIIIHIYIYIHILYIIYICVHMCVYIYIYVCIYI